MIKLDQKVRFKPGNRTGFVVKDLGVVKEPQSRAPMALHTAPEQCWAVVFWHDDKTPATELGEAVGRVGYADVHGCKESDLEPA